jgi:hypothetical protein
MVLYHFYSRKVAKVAKPLIIFKNLPPLRNVFQTEILPGEQLSANCHLLFLYLPDERK